jgi:hypothetical protein
MHGGRIRCRHSLAWIPGKPSSLRINIKRSNTKDELLRSAPVHETLCLHINNNFATEFNALYMLWD